MTLGAAGAGRQRGGSEETSWLRGSVLALRCVGAGPQGQPMCAWEAMATEMGFWGDVEVSNAHSSSCFVQKQWWKLLLCEASKLLLELPSLSGAAAFLLPVQAVSTSSLHFPISCIPQLVLSEI